MFHWKVLGCANNDCLWLWRFTLSPKHKRWSDLELRWDYGLQGEHRGGMLRIVGFHRHSFHLCAGAFANVEGGRDLTFLSRRHFLLLGLRSRATARSADRFESHGFAAGVLIFKMAYRLLVGSRRMQFDRGLVPFQFRARSDANDD